MLAIALTLMLACQGGVSTPPPGNTNTDSAGDTADTGPTDDLVCPTIEHTQIEKSQPIGLPVDISAVVVDSMSGVFVVELYYKQEITTTWARLTMALTDTDTYTTQIPGADVGSGGMDYYIKAVDTAQNSCTAPTDGENDPYHFRVDGG